MVRIGEIKKKNNYNKMAINAIETKEKNQKLKLIYCEKRGRGIKAINEILKGEVVTEYSGELITHKEAKQRDEVYSKQDKFESYMIYFKQNEKKYAIDAQSENNTYGRLINHSKKKNNVKPVVFVYKKVPKIVLVAKRNIEKDEEILFDYGENDKQIIKANPWLND